ncbi:AraC family transcriptional regulator [Virgisporangium ochraceum]|uniref:AraC family transcriptional regulator n=1 Tax=Virgisporangium ochraceum TaxID=65505 RepID=A0A8J4E9M9_9ACTN|nr:helix-turn-helix domain-containing protein [Virgisporangium ochraceum]GIJ66493.1 AraC family transcriptional regulator [Virgisporangium ochraceum]
MLTVDRQESGGIRWESARRPPEPRLAGLVSTVVGYAEFADRPVVRRVTPHPAVTVILNLGEPIAVHGVPRRTFVAGLHDTWGTTEFTGGQRGIELGLTPQGAHRLLRVPPGELTGLVVDLPVLDRLADRLAAADGWAERLDLLDAALLGLAADGPQPDPAVEWAWAVMRGRHGAVRVGDLVAATGWSRRHFVNRFRAEVGLPPKVAARVVRFQRASRLLGTGVPAAVAAATCGYTDQSHLVREFRALAGVTPGSFVAGLDAEQVTFLQDADRAGLLASGA